MTDIATVRRLALALPGVEDCSSDVRLSFEAAGGKGLAWSFMRRDHPKKPRVPDLSVLAVRCDLARKEMLIAAAPDRFFEDSHYRGYPAILVRLAAVDEDELAALLADALALSTAPPRRRRSA